jgi:hypothetical protein
VTIRAGGRYEQPLFANELPPSGRDLGSGLAPGARFERARRLRADLRFIGAGAPGQSGVFFSAPDPEAVYDHLLRSVVIRLSTVSE